MCEFVLEGWEGFKGEVCVKSEEEVQEGGSESFRGEDAVCREAEGEVRERWEGGSGGEGREGEGGEGRGGEGGVERWRRAVVREMHAQGRSYKVPEYHYRRQIIIITTWNWYLILLATHWNSRGNGRG